MTNAKVYNLTKVTKWSITIRKRRLTWFGHLLRVDKETHARKALTVACKPIKKKPGRQKLTWLELMRKDVNAMFEPTAESNDSFCEKASEICQDRANWRKTVFNNIKLKKTSM